MATKIKSAYTLFLSYNKYIKKLILFHIKILSKAFVTDNKLWMKESKACSCPTVLRFQNLCPKLYFSELEFLLLFKLDTTGTIAIAVS